MSSQPTLRFLHMADCHVGAWRDPRMKALTHEAFSKAAQAAIEEQVDFVIIAGDLFHTALPGIESLKAAVAALQKLKEANIPVYCIAGSHDFSPSGKTMLDVLEEANLLKNVTRGTVEEGKLKLTLTTDEKTGVKLTGILGRRGMLDRTYYEELNRDALEQEAKESSVENGGAGSLFLFHTSLDELKPKELAKMESTPASFLPKGFDYYAGGHVHIVADTKLPGYAQIVYPGPVFPTSFSELAQLSAGSYCIVEKKSGEGPNTNVGNGFVMRREKLTLKEVITITIDADKKAPSTINQELEATADKVKPDSLVLLKIHGELREGCVGDVDTRAFFARAYDAGAYFVMKNTSKLTSAEYEEVAVATGGDPDAVEEQLLQEHTGQQPITDADGKTLDAKAEVALTKELMRVLGQAQRDGEKKYEYDARVADEAKRIIE